MPKKLSPEEATVMIIRRRLQQMEEAKMAKQEKAGDRTAANDDDIGFAGAGATSGSSSETGSPDSESPSVQSDSADKDLSKE